MEKLTKTEKVLVVMEDLEVGRLTALEKLQKYLRMKGITNYDVEHAMRVGLDYEQLEWSMGLENYYEHVWNRVLNAFDLKPFYKALEEIGVC